MVIRTIEDILAGEIPFIAGRPVISVHDLDAQIVIESERLALFLHNDGLVIGIGIDDYISGLIDVIDLGSAVEGFQKEDLEQPQQDEDDDSKSDEVDPDIELEWYLAECSPYFFTELQTYIPFLSG